MTQSPGAAFSATGKGKARLGWVAACLTLVLVVVAALSFGQYGVSLAEAFRVVAARLTGSESGQPPIDPDQ